MGDILIKGMEMPKDGEKLYMIAFSDGKACASYKPFEWHEVVPVPSHGRLGDLDALRKDWLENGKNEYVYDTNAFLDSLDNAPTIIPADPAEEGKT